MPLVVKLPVGIEPDWEVKEAVDEDGDETALKAVNESFALLHSLRESRKAWLTTIFPKFSSKTKGKSQTEIVPPPHSIKPLAKCDVKIGLHTFYDTSFFEVSYPSDVVQQPIPAAPHTPSSAAAPEEPVSPTLITQVNEAASANPVLQNLLQIAASGHASQEQLQTLGLFIHTLASRNVPPQNLPSVPTGPPQTHVPSLSPPKKPDIIFDFKENTIDRLLLPREINACELGTSDIVLYTFVPFGKVDEVDEEGHITRPSKSPAVIRILDASMSLRAAMKTWLSEDAMGLEAKESFMHLAQSDPRAFPQFRLPEGDLLSQLQQSSNDTYPMRFLKSSTNSESAKPRRVRQRKSVPKPTPVSQATPSVEGQDSPSVSKEPPKRRRQTPKISADIACTICGMKGVPLLRGGRICHNCLYPTGNSPSTTSSFRSGIFITTVAPPPPTIVATSQQVDQVAPDTSSIPTSSMSK